MPGTYDFTRVKGNTAAFQVRLRSFDAAGSTFVFRAESRSGATLSRTSVDAGISVLDEVDGAGRMATLTWSLTPAETRLLGGGKVNTYELERRIAGAEETLLMGSLIMIGGANADA